MEEPEKESLDGSSIKPVSSLRMQFEQMANSKSAAPTPRAVSPKPASTNVINGNHANSPAPNNGVKLTAEIGAGSARGRERDIREQAGLQPPRRNDSANLSPSPTRCQPPRPASRIQTIVAPAVTVDPPQSPPKVKALNLNLVNPSTHLFAESPTSALSGRSSPGHFRIPSRPHTPVIESGRSSPRFAGRPGPPSPPPPRRSGEFRRDASLKAAPPPVNRADKPRIASKPASMKLEPSSLHLHEERSSPFSTPPGSDSSPEHELPAPALPPNKPRNMAQPGPNVPLTPRNFDPPPIHHAVVSKRREHETNGLGRGIITPQVTGDPRPALPTRPQGGGEILNSRALVQNTMLPPPPPRVSIDRTRPSISTTDSGKEYLTPPKRVFSTPTTQVQTPPRHGRSMTVDRTSDRTPMEFRAPVTTLSNHSEPRVSTEGVASSYIKDTLSRGLSEYPDSTHSNRRPPYFKQGIREIGTKYDTRIFDVCGEFLCTSGHLTRVWNMRNGENIMSLVHTEGVKMLSVAFKPASDANDEGSRVWLGDNMGNLYEVDIAIQNFVATKGSAHTRREIIRIYRHKNEMWTLDDSGTLHLWAADKSGAPTLSNPYNSFRVSKGHTFSMVVGDELWHASGKDIRIFVPSLDANVQFQVLSRPIGQPTAGDVTSGTTIINQPDRVYFGHVDGKVSVYSRKDYSCLGIFNISLYKITSLVGSGGKLWAGFSTGMIYVYDITVAPWAVRKDWRAHSEPLMGMISDPSSFWSLDRAQVISLGQDNMLRVWDGLLQDDWIETQMHSQEGEFCELETIRTLVMTWNAGASTPYHLQHSDQDATFFRNLLASSGSPDILVFGFQELVDLEDKKTTAKSFFKTKKKDPSTDLEKMSHQYRDWRDFLTRCLDDYMPSKDLYHLLYTSSLVGLFTCIFVKSTLRERIHSICGAEVKRGMGGLHGNKGALVVRFVLDDSSMCFINCHLAAGQASTKDRNADITAILEGAILPAERDANIRQDSFIGGGDGTMIMDHELCILNGDLNYRIDTMGRDTVVSAVKANNFSKLLDRDQLLASKRKNPWFRLRAFHELPIAFAPTYKYDVGTDTYDTSEKKRAPAWCDRLLYRGLRIKQLDYQRHEVRVSDHRPVSGMFEMVVKSVSPKERAMKWDECQKQLLALKEKSGKEAKLHYLTNFLGYDHATAQKLVLQSENVR
ncbi:putative PI phosphatase group protein-like protein [Bisporella sp. PMI_857]|nr:putative PI phosphatase group protein-like protein [Bisporella sp. PMI_857]